ncbi:MAG: trigger factor [Symbiobacteriaceae bacterium]|jgi:trigger factor|nr:trigger factor [Symbiobacteriaceae bacterium]
MKATWDKLEKNWMQFEVEVEAGEFAKAIDAAFRKLNQRVTVPGFRKGKAPRALFERNYGKESLVNEAIDELLPRAYGEALLQSNVEPIDQPKVDLVQAEEGKPFIFKGKVEVVPEVTLGKLSGFGIARPSGDVTAEQIDQQLTQLRDRMATLVTDDSGEVKQGSFAVIDFEGFVDGVAFEGGKGENHTLEIGSGSFIPGFEEQLVGAKAGQDVEVKVSFPVEYNAEHLAGKEALFKVSVKEVKRKELPELSDEFAAEVSKHQTLAELRADIEKRLAESAKNNAEQEYQSKIIEAVANEATVELPHVLVHRRVHDLIHDFERTLTSQGLSMEFWQQATGKTSHDLHEQYEVQAKESVKQELVLGAVGRQEGLTVSDAELEAEFDQMLARYKGQEKEVKQLRKNVNYRERLRDQLLLQKTIDHLVSLNAPQG